MRVAQSSDPSAQLILVVDDDPASRDLVARYLVRGGFRVEVAGDGVGALERARALQPAAITLDVLMPGMDGWAVLAEAGRSRSAAGDRATHGC